MKIYLVGGAVRDKLLKKPVNERDWVVVGSSPEAMMKLGYQPVGKEFPVFLHPKTKEEYALARTERKVSKGYKGFTFYTDPDVTLEQDLKRRDLTINAIAEDHDGNLIDPYHGQQDLQQKLLRHISLHFAEDPVRILRIARFAAKLPEFTVADDTNQLMKSMVENGEVNALVAERVWKECQRALTECAPQRFFEVLHACDALAVLFPELKLDGMGMCLLKNLSQQPQAALAWAVLLHDLQETELHALNQRYKVPKEFSELSTLVCKYHRIYANLKNLTPEDMLQFIRATDALRRPKRFTIFLNACHICTEVNNLSFIEKIIAALKAIDIAPLHKQQLKGQAFANALQELQMHAIKQCL